jgi:hypothetical protein
MTMRIGLALLCCATTLWSVGCKVDIDSEDYASAQRGSVETFFNNPGTREQNGYDSRADDMLVHIIDQAKTSLELSVMGFTRAEIIDAVVRAHERGVHVRHVGDGRHLLGGTWGYEALEEAGIPTISGNMYSIMHNKFFIIDDRFVVTGTGNITPTGFARNDNNWVLIDDVRVAADFKAEFEQLFAGRFGAAKQEVPNGNVYEVGGETVEVFFSPQEDAMGRILQYVDAAQHSIHFYIFAFTKDQVGSSFIERDQAFQRYNACCDPERSRDGETQAACDAADLCGDEPFSERGVFGVIDRSQLHSNGPYHEAYRLLTYQVQMRQDGNVNSYQPGDYQAGGGRQHAKTMVIDAGTPNAVVITGSFNWSSSATVSNDETLVILHGERLAAPYLEQWEYLWERGTEFGEDWVGEDGLEAGDVVFNEIHWDGWNGEQDLSDLGGDDVYNDEFIELLNRTDRTIDLSMWTIATDDDFVLGLYPGTVIGPGERFLIVDHNLEAYTDLNPQLGVTAFDNPDFVMNTANDPRFLRMNLHNARFTLRLLDPRGNVVDRAGDGGPPFAGGRAMVDTDGDGSRETMRNFSMERIHTPADGPMSRMGTVVAPGDTAEAWAPAANDTVGDNILGVFRDRIRATPGEPNSSAAFPAAEDPMYRSPTGVR